ncbi:hypothetical protein Taro_055260 [Colocasia esculenta]|uniref:Uncharacterized protein n=1 Tax=Colocasia esculenta TaxID=4460 RepID=A0A843XT22_COLES|nr:hypothetical protein [Colocasia esculenta]
MTWELNGEEEGRKGGEPDDRLKWEVGRKDGSGEEGRPRVTVGLVTARVPSSRVARGSALIDHSKRAGTVSLSSVLNFVDVVFLRPSPPNQLYVEMIDLVLLAPPAGSMDKIIHLSLLLRRRGVQGTLIANNYLNVGEILSAENMDRRQDRRREIFRSRNRYSTSIPKPTSAKVSLKEMRCPSFSVSTSTPSQSKSSAAGRATPKEGDDGEEEAAAAAEQTTPAPGCPSLSAPTRKWMAEAEPCVERSGRVGGANREGEERSLFGRRRVDDGVEAVAAAADAAAIANPGGKETLPTTASLRKTFKVVIFLGRG